MPKRKDKYCRLMGFLIYMVTADLTKHHSLVSLILGPGLMPSLRVRSVRVRKRRSCHTIVNSTKEDETMGLFSGPRLTSWSLTDCDFLDHMRSERTGKGKMGEIKQNRRFAAAKTCKEVFRSAWREHMLYIYIYPPFFLFTLYVGTPPKRYDNPNSENSFPKETFNYASWSAA